MSDSTPATAACEWCGRAVKRNSEGRWYAVKGEERGYDPLTCEASDDCRHEPDQPATAVLRDWPCTNPDHLGLCSDDHAHADHVVAGDAPKLRVEKVEQPRVEDGYAYVARLLGDERIDGMNRSVAMINVFTCLRCGALVADQDAHGRWHD